MITDRERRLIMKIELIDDNNCLIDDTFIKLSAMGGCRRKSFYGNYIIKFDRSYPDDSYNSQNEREIDLWKIMDKKDRKYFPKMIQYSKKDGYLIQERIRFRRGRKAISHRDIVMNLIEKYDITDISFSGDNDNWGVRENGLPVIYDYGYYDPFY